MKKISLFMLMAVGLLISTSMSAMPERPVPPEPKAPEGVEMVRLETSLIPQKRQLSALDLSKSEALNTNKIRKVAQSLLGDEIVAKVGSQEFFTLSEAINYASTTTDDIVLQKTIEECVVFDNVVTIDLNGFDLKLIDADINADVTFKNSKETDNSVLFVDNTGVCTYFADLLIEGDHVNVQIEGGLFHVSDADKYEKFVNTDRYKFLIYENVKYGLVKRVYDANEISEFAECKIGEVNYYYEFSKALVDVQPTETIEVLNNVIDEQLVIEKSCTIDLNGFTILEEYNQSAITIKNSANVVITDGKIYTSYYYYYDTDGNTVKTYTYGIILESGSLILDDIIVDSWNDEYYEYRGTTNSSKYAPAYGIYTDTGTSIKLMGNTYVCGWMYGGYSKSNVIIEGNTILEGYWYYAWDTNTENGATVEINDNATFKGSDNVYSAAYFTGGARTTINGGTFIGVTGFPAVYTNASNVQVNGGLFITKECDYAIMSWIALPPVQGGTFTTPHLGYDNKESTASCINPAKWGYAFAEDGLNEELGVETWTVLPVIAQIAGSETYYFSLQDAIDSASAGDEIIFFKSTNSQAWTEITENVTIEKSLTINLNGKNIAGELTAKGTGVVVSIRDKGNITGTLNVADGGTYKLYGGTYSFYPEEFVPQGEGCSITPDKNAEGPWTVSQVVAKIGNIEYTSFNEAVNAVAANQTILLTQNTSFTNVTLSKNVTIDLGGKVLSVSGANSLTCSANITITNGTIQNAISALSYPEQIITNKNTLTLNNVTISNKGKYAVKNNANAALTLNTGANLSSAIANVYGNGISTINNNVMGASVMLSSAGVTINNDASASVTLSSNATNTAAVTINNGLCTFVGGYFTGENSISITNGATVSVEAGVYSPSNKETLNTLLASNKMWNKVKYMGNDAYQILDEGTEMLVQDAEGNKYASLLEAIQFVPANGTAKFTLLDNFTTSDSYTIASKQNITLDLAGFTLTSENRSSGDLFSVNGEFIIDDSSANGSILGTGKILIKDKGERGIRCNGTVTINNGTIEGRSSDIVFIYAGSVTMNHGYIKALEGNGVRSFYNAMTLTLKDGTIEGNRPITIQLGGATNTDIQTVNMNGGKLIATSDIAIYCWTNGADYGNAHINITEGEIYGKVYLEAYTTSSTIIKYAEKLDVKGGIFNTHYAIFNGEKGRGAITNLHYIEGGAYFFDYANNSSNHSFSEFCEYIKPGHYATIMCLNDDATGTVGTDYIEYQGHKFTFGPCSDDGKEFWAVIDALGSSKVDTITNGTKDNPVVLNPDDYQPIDEILINGGVVEVQSGDTLEVNRIQVGKDGNGAGVIVRTDATLIVGLNGLQVDEASTTDDKVTYVIVEAGGTLETNGTIISNDVKEIIIESDETYGTGVVYIAPDVTYNNQPRSTISMYTHACHSEDGTWHWQHFGIPSIGIDENGESDFNNPTNPKITANPATNTYMAQWLNNEWVDMTKWSEMNVPFRGYNLTNDSQEGGVTYTFEGRMIGNGNAPLKFTHLGYNVLANSYTAPIHIASMFEDMQRDFGSNVQSTVWIYDSENDSHIFTNLYEQKTGDAQFSYIAPMQGYILLLQNGSSASGSISYEKAVWENRDPENKHPLFAPQISNVAKANIVISSSKSNDRVKLYEDADYTTDFEDGADASKYMNNAMNIYANTTFGDAACVVADNLENMYLSITTGNEEVYTLTFENVNNMNYMLRDLITGQYITIEEGVEYPFVAPANAKMEHRFQIVSAAQVPTDMKEMKAKKASGAYTLMGQYLGNVEQLGNLQQGVYIVNGVKVIK